MCKTSCGRIIYQANDCNISGSPMGRVVMTEDVEQVYKAMWRNTTLNTPHLSEYTQQDGGYFCTSSCLSSAITAPPQAVTHTATLHTLLICLFTAY